MGFSNWQTLKPHALRAPFITFLANDNSMSTQETMGAARHRSVGASTPYQKRSLESEDNRLKAVLGKRTINDDDYDFEELKSGDSKKIKLQDSLEDQILSKSDDKSDEDYVILSGRNDKKSRARKDNEKSRCLQKAHLLSKLWMV